MRFVQFTVAFESEALYEGLKVPSNIVAVSGDYIANSHSVEVVAGGVTVCDRDTGMTRRLADLKGCKADISYSTFPDDADSCCKQFDQFNLSMFLPVGFHGWEAAFSIEKGYLEDLADGDGLIESAIGTGMISVRSFNTNCFFIMNYEAKTTIRPLELYLDGVIRETVNLDILVRAA